MLNLPELEKRWLRYKIKSYTPYALATLGVVALGTTALFVDFSSFNTPSPHPIQTHLKKETSDTKIIQKDNVSHVKMQPQNKIAMHTALHTYIPQRNSVHKEVQHATTRLTPSMHFITQLEQRKYTPPQVQTTVQKPKTIHTPKPKQKPHVQQSEQRQTQTQPSKYIRIKKQNARNDINEIVKRFKKTRNPALSLFAAKKYYELGEYKQAYNYALITNQINQDIEDSWIIFSKALMKLGKEEQAKRTLRKYIRYSHSQKARMLLEEIKSGKFK